MLYYTSTAFDTFLMATKKPVWMCLPK